MKSKKIIIAVSGSIAAYKAAYLIRACIAGGAEVRVLMTESAKAFISPLTLSTLSRNPVYSNVIDHDSWNNHVELGLWADALIVAPATANTIAKMAHGICDNIISAVYLSARCPVFIAPAMDLDMWTHGSTRNNIKTLESYGDVIIDPEEGELASGLVGKGRMAEPEHILKFVQEHIDKKKDLTGKQVLITAGPTRENLDPVRYITNPSTGKMGVALANACAGRGATVELVLGPTDNHTLLPGVQLTRVNSAEEMFNAARARHGQSDIVIFSAAVADYTPVSPSGQKIKKAEDQLSLELTRTKDIAFELGKNKRPGQIHVGFALETENEEANATDKLTRKNFDLIVLNSLNDEGAGFGHDTNKVKLIMADHPARDIKLKSKTELAEDIINTFMQIFVKA